MYYAYSDSILMLDVHRNNIYIQLSDDDFFKR